MDALVCWIFVAVAITFTPVSTAQFVTSSRSDAGFSCADRVGGYYADVEDDCRSYYLCGPTGRLYRFDCPPHTRFNQKYVVCDHVYHVSCSKSQQFFDLNELIGKTPRSNGKNDAGSKFGSFQNTLQSVSSKRSSGSGSSPTRQKQLTLESEGPLRSISSARVSSSSARTGRTGLKAVASTAGGSGSSFVSSPTTSQFGSSGGRALVSSSARQFDSNGAKTLVSSPTSQFSSNSGRTLATSPASQFSSSGGRTLASSPNGLFGSSGGRTLVSSPTSQFGSNGRRTFVSSSNKQFVSGGGSSFVSSPTKQFGNNGRKTLVSSSTSQFGSNSAGISVSSPTRKFGNGGGRTRQEPVSAFSRKQVRPSLSPGSGGSVESTGIASQPAADLVPQLLVSLAGDHPAVPPASPDTRTRTLSAVSGGGGALRRRAGATPTTAEGAGIGRALLRLAAAGAADGALHQSSNSHPSFQTQTRVSAAASSPSHAVVSSHGAFKPTGSRPIDAASIRTSNLPDEQRWRLSQGALGSNPTPVSVSRRIQLSNRVGSLAGHDTTDPVTPTRRIQLSSRGARPAPTLPDTVRPAPTRPDAVRPDPTRAVVGWTARPQLLSHQSQSTRQCGLCLPIMIQDWNSCSPCVRAL